MAQSVMICGVKTWDVSVEKSTNYWQSKWITNDVTAGEQD
jgi:hypothetical protein